MLFLKYSFKLSLLDARMKDKRLIINKMRTLITVALMFLFLLPLASAQFTPNIWKKFIGEPVPVGTPDLIDYSYAGYKNGEVAIPDDFTLPIFNVTDYGAIPDDVESDTEGIKAAFDAAYTGRQGGIVFFPPGQYDVLLDGEKSNPITVSGDNVIVRGSGAEGAAHGGTTIKMHNKLTDSNRLFKTRWRSNGRGSSTRVKESFPRGTKHFDVEDVSSLRNRRFIEIRSDRLLGEDWNQHSSRPITEILPAYTNIRKGISVYEIHEIDHIDGDRVYVKAPVLTHLNSNFTVNWRDMTVGIGFEDLHIDGNLQETYKHLVQEGRGGITLWHAAHSWIRRCRFSNTINAFGHHVSYSCSALEIILDGRFGHVPGSVTVSTYCFIGLLEDYTDNGMWHGVQSASSSTGTVIWEIDGKKMRGPDTHGSQPRHTLFDNYNSINHQASGGAISNLPHHLDGYTRWNNTVSSSRTFDLWNPGGYSFAVTQANLIGYKTLGGSIPRNAYFEGFGTHVFPDSLYEAQLEQRLGTLPAWVNAAKGENKAFYEHILPALDKTDTTITPPTDIDDNLDPSQGSPKIEGPWLWVLTPDERLDKTTDLLAKASDGTVTEQQIATTGVSPGDTVGEYEWTSLKISSSGGNNITNMTRPLGWNGNNRVIYGFISLKSPHEQHTRMFVGSDDSVKVWLNDELVREEIVGRSASDYKSSFPVFLKQRVNTILVAVENRTGSWNGFFGFQADAEYTVLPFASIGYVLPNVEIYADDIFTLDIYAENVVDLAGWQFDITFDPLLLEAIEVRKDYFLVSEGRETSFHEGTIDNKSGNIIGLSETELDGNSANGTGLFLSLTFAAKAGGKTQLTLNNFRFSDNFGQSISAGPLRLTLGLKGKLIWDVNGDGRVSILDMILVARDIGKTVSPDSQNDRNGDGIISISDLILVAQHMGELEIGAAPTTISIEEVKGLDPATVQAWIKQAHAEDDGSLAFQKGIANLERILAVLIPKKTALLPNYPNPFNPETWIPYKLSEPTEVTITIYAVNGTKVRTLALGLMPAGIYQSRNRAAHWDGRNDVSEPVASDIYFYTLTADKFISTRKMLILK